MPYDDTLVNDRSTGIFGRDMNAITPQVVFTSAYKRLAPAERSYVDSVVREIEEMADRSNEPISLYTRRPLPAHMVERGGNLIERERVCIAITERIHAIAADRELTVNRVQKELMSIAFSSVGDYMVIGEDGAPVFDLSSCTPEQLSAIKSIDMEEVGDGFSRASKRKFKFQLHDKLAAIKMLGQYMGMLEPDNPHWRAEKAKTEAPALPDNATAEQAGDAYARFIDA